MECPKCQHENPARAKFCLECGTRFNLLCPACSEPLPESAKFCLECGHELSKPVTQAASTTLSTSPEGERRQATVLFSDLSGYTAMNERLDPEEVRGIVGRIKAEAVRIVEGHGGIVNQFVGDEILALFGIPSAHEDDPARAVRSARDLHELVRSVSPEVEEKIGAPLQLHSGIATGLIVTGNEDRRDGTFGITGDTVNTGARLAAHAEPDTVLVSPETQRLIADYFQTEALAPVELRGKAEPVTPYRVIEQTAVASRFEAAQRRGFTRFAGRGAELATLQGALDKAITGQGQFVTIMGEPGVGKSRLMFEFRHGLDPQRIAVLEGRCQSYGTDTPYLPFIDALRRGLRMEEAQGADALHDHAVAAVLGISPDLEPFMPHYLHLLSIPSETHILPDKQQGEALRRALEEALAAIVTLTSQIKPLVVVLEDWHWADEASDAALKNLADLVAHHPIQLVVTYRPEYERHWSDPGNYSPLVLKPLEEDDTATMLRAVFGAAELPPGLAERVHERTGGNALFNEEVANGLLEEGAVAVNDGRAELAGLLEEIHLPDTVHAVIRARVDRLDPEAPGGAAAGVGDRAGVHPRCAGAALSRGGTTGRRPGNPGQAGPGASGTGRARGCLSLQARAGAGGRLRDAAPAAA